MSGNKSGSLKFTFNMRDGGGGDKMTLNTVINSIKGSEWKDPKKWPKSLHEFIARSFREASKRQFNENEVQQFKSQLKNLINMAITTNSMLKNDWSKQKIPLLSSPGRSRLALYCQEIKGETKNNIQRRREAALLAENNHDSGINKRKNIFGEDESDSESGTYITMNNKPTIVLGDSLKRLKKQKMETSTPQQSYSLRGDTLSDQERLQLRSKRFERELAIPVTNNYVEETISTRPIVGRNQNLEKKYLRLTSQPNPEAVRPLDVLHKTLQLLLDKYFDGSSYNYLCDQCKSMRQDLTVQNIKQDFSIMAYEFHSKIAIENEDWGEFNQCQSQLKVLYGIPSLHKPNYYEFLSYRILYYILTNNYNEVFELELTLMDSGTLDMSNIHLNYVFTLFKHIYNSDYYSLSKVVKKIALENEKKEELAIESSKYRHIMVSDDDCLLLKHNELFYFTKFINVIMERVNIQTLSIICKSYRQISVLYLKEMLCKDRNEYDFNKFISDNKLQNFVDTESKIFNCVAARTVVENLRSKLFNKIDIKGQI